ncbi:MAG: DUF5063 domain-containing protein [Candidatus Eremiobacteraeota bacterium]|nr:DUF5063 domain-containing protein [Candidatus Eremiobacteraeota bacterium]
MARDFAYYAELYVTWFDEVVSDEATPLSMRRLHEVLALLQAAAARLTAIPPDDEADSDFEGRDVVGALRAKLPTDAYSVVFDPFEYDPLEVNPPKPVMATIADDLGDIYNNVKEGLALYRAGQIQNALWHWHFSYYAHWGRHLSNAQPAIWQYLREGNSVQ